MDQLEQYWNKLKVSDINLPEFESLNDDDKKYLQNTLGFAAFKVGLATSDLKASVKQNFFWLINSIKNERS